MVRETDPGYADHFGRILDAARKQVPAFKPTHAFWEKYFPALKTNSTALWEVGENEKIASMLMSAAETLFQMKLETIDAGDFALAASELSGLSGLDKMRVQVALLKTAGEVLHGITEPRYKIAPLMR